MLGLRLLGSQKHKRSGWSLWATSATSNLLPQPHLDSSRFPPLSSFGVVMKRTSVYSITISSSSVAHFWNGAQATCCPSPQANGRPSWETHTGRHSGPNKMIRLQHLTPMFSGNTGALFSLAIYGAWMSLQGVMTPHACYLVTVSSRCLRLMIQTFVR